MKTFLTLIGIFISSFIFSQDTSRYIFVAPVYAHSKTYNLEMAKQVEPNADYISKINSKDLRTYGIGLGFYINEFICKKKIRRIFPELGFFVLPYFKQTANKTDTNNMTHNISFSSLFLTPVLGLELNLVRTSSFSFTAIPSVNYCFIKDKLVDNSNSIKKNSNRIYYSIALRLFIKKFINLPLAWAANFDLNKEKKLGFGFSIGIPFKVRK